MYGFVKMVWRDLWLSRLKSRLDGVDPAWLAGCLPGYLVFVETSQWLAHLRLLSNSDSLDAFVKVRTPKVGSRAKCPTCGREKLAGSKPQRIPNDGKNAERDATFFWFYFWLAIHAALLLFHFSGNVCGCKVNFFFYRGCGVQLNWKRMWKCFIVTGMESRPCLSEVLLR